MRFDITAHLDEVTTLIQDASIKALDWFRQPVGDSGLVVDNKAGPGRFDPVTEADRSVEDEIRTGLTELFPDHEIVGEERGTSGQGSDEVPTNRWVIDPIDGTRAFISGQPMWGTLVGLQQDGKPTAGWLYQPTMGETYVASPAGGYWYSSAGRRALQTSKVTTLNDAILLCTHPSMFETDAEQSAFGAVESASKLTRYSGDCVNYALLATGSADLVVENQMQPYDIVPLIPIIEAAGGVVTGIDGQAPLEGGWVIAAATPELHQEALAALQGQL